MSESRRIEKLKSGGNYPVWMSAMSKRLKRLKAWDVTRPLVGDENEPENGEAIEAKKDIAMDEIASALDQFHLAETLRFESPRLVWAHIASLHVPQTLEDKH